MPFPQYQQVPPFGGTTPRLRGACPVAYAVASELSLTHTCSRVAAHRHPAALNASWGHHPLSRSIASGAVGLVAEAIGRRAIARAYCWYASFPMAVAV